MSGGLGKHLLCTCKKSIILVFVKGNEGTLLLGGQMCHDMPCPANVTRVAKPLQHMEPASAQELLSC